MNEESAIPVIEDDIARFGVRQMFGFNREYVAWPQRGKHALTGYANADGSVFLEHFGGEAATAFIPRAETHEKGL